MRLQKFQFVADVDLGALHFHLPPTEKRNSCHPIVCRLARSCTRYFSNLKGRDGMPRASVAGSWHCRRGTTPASNYLPRLMPSLREIRRTRDCGFAEVSNASPVILSLVLPAKVITLRDTWCYIFALLSSPRSSNVAVATLFITTANNNPFMNEKKKETDAKKFKHIGIK